MYYLSVLSIFKNETINLKLWLDHYLWQGAEHFYLIDNGSTDEPLNILQEYIDKGNYKDALKIALRADEKELKEAGVSMDDWKYLRDSSTDIFVAVKNR
jgi:hypothetical protein